MKIKLILFTVIVICSNVAIAQTPTIIRDATSKYIYIPEQTNSNDFMSVSQIKIGPYLTIGNFGLINRSWIGNNAILDYSSYSDLGSVGNKNMFIPQYNNGRALVMEFDYSNARLNGYTYSWNQNSSPVDLNNFTLSWYLGPDKAYLKNSLEVDGNVTIGTGTNPNNYKLAVNGTIGAKEIKIENSSWADFVFEDEYQLRSLDEVGLFIEKNKHLPDIPTESEVEKSGVDLGAMNSKMLQKIEELTLYMVQMNKEIKSLKSENSELKERIDLLESNQ